MTFYQFYSIWFLLIGRVMFTLTLLLLFVFAICFIPPMTAENIRDKLLGWVAECWIWCLAIAAVFTVLFVLIEAFYEAFKALWL